MKIPKRPPPLSELFGQIKGERLIACVTEVGPPTVDGKYLHWDELRYRTPPRWTEPDGVVVQSETEATEP